MKCPFNLRNKKQVIRFDEIDPYNPQNRVRGYVNRRQGQLYGALYITHVNNKPQYQLIYSAPKQHYPFDKDMKWEFPECDTLHIYTKLDGTCVISFLYKNSSGDKFLSYKTRLRPFLGSGRYGNFFELWNEMREKYPDIDKDCWSNIYNIIFELYGKRNKILIDYDVPLDTKVIFAVDCNNGKIITPRDVPTCLPIVDLYGTSSNQVSEDNYIQVQNQLESELEIDEENKIMKGREGTVWYFLKEGFATQIKCKPPTVLKYHWSGDAIAYESIYTTIVNAFENFDNPTYEDVVQLLKEEFDENKIEKSRIRIVKLLSRVTFDKKLQFELVKDYKKLGVDINEDKVTVMRWFGQHYPKSESKRIYRLLKQYEVKKE